jgi:hypothetical protein
MAGTLREELSRAAVAAERYLARVGSGELDPNAPGVADVVKAARQVVEAERVEVARDAELRRLLAASWPLIHD